ncbi:Ankyrin repeat and zinc finger domain-containing protein 1 [Boothiomyces sp. JEL0838]|nr:Ankyrin repeat and zinc finger domain-containing protein 1 [Boothiomyces sp. JEL0838]
MERFPVFKIPNKLLDSIEYEQDVIEEEEEIKIEEGGIPCTTCLISTTKSHFKSDLHLYNLKRKVKQLKPLTEDEFDDKSDISSIDEESSEDETEPVKQGSPYAEFKIKDKVLQVYKQVLSKDPKEWKDNLLELQQKSTFTLLMMASGHFSAMIIDSEKKQLVHKTFHRYTTRRKQGGAQSGNDNSKGKANSAGAQIRRYNEQVLREEIQQLLKDWKPLISESKYVFIKCPVQSRSVILFDEKIIDPSKVRSFPFITNRPTLQELTRAFDLLFTANYVEIKEHEIKSKKEKEIVEKVQTHLQIQELEREKIPESLQYQLEAIKKGRLEYLISILDKDSITSTFPVQYGFTLLHYASEQGQPLIIKYLLENGADPTIAKLGKRPYDVCSTKEARDVYRRHMHHYPDQWDYKLANVPGPLTEEMEERQKEKERERRKKEREMKKKKKEQPEPEPAPVVETKQTKKVTLVKLSATEKQSIGMSPEQRQRLDREKR